MDVLELVDALQERLGVPFWIGGGRFGCDLVVDDLSLSLRVRGEEQVFEVVACAAGVPLDSPAILEDLLMRNGGGVVHDGELWAIGPDDRARKIVRTAIAGFGADHFIGIIERFADDLAGCVGLRGHGHRNERPPAFEDLLR